MKISEWGEYKIGEILEKYKGFKHSCIPENTGGVAFITSSSKNNGVSKFVNEESIGNNFITISTNGACFDAFYHDYDICISTDVEAYTHKKLNLYTASFLCTIFKLEKYRWNYGRKPKNNKVSDTIIKLPKATNGKPNWEYMENYIKNLPYADLI